MNILVAGGAGFLGSHLCERLLNEKHTVICIDNLLTGNADNLKDLQVNNRFSFIKHDVIRPLSLTQKKLDAIFHLASPASPNHHSPISYHKLPEETMLANTKGTFELLRLAEKNHAKFMFASTSEVYGDPLVHPQNEEYRGNVSTTGPRSIYDEAKRFGETITAHFWRDRGVDGRIVRIFNTYGPHMQRSDMRMIVIFITQALAGEPITIFGDGTQTRSLCYVDDTIEGMIRFMFHPKTKGEIINIGAVEEHSVLEFAQLVKKLTASSSKIIFSEKLPEDDPKKRKPDISKAEKLLGWTPKINLEDGLTKIINHFKSVGS